ncbi:hypothetical protein Q9299_13960 [Gemmobacter fulvus]|uniref:hypothetical protein n=1 Tax=Gemmobacter fulvus TaxID=2840474 RepID=UPI002796C370|nr:hypothetical protein [Gemmobacter fulvus]MDQ1849398.1 hypothetical protein [Gemmobacter fulvus]
MIGASKILTVSYGTFSCTLEGFDDPFNTMKAIAEYFRDLAAEDRYFGAEPPTPDAAMLHKIAEREIQRRVEAKIQDNGVILRAGEAKDQAPRSQIAPLAQTETPAVAAQPVPAPTAAPAVPIPETTSDSVAAKLMRIRSAVAQTTAAQAKPAALPVSAVQDYSDEAEALPPTLAAPVQDDSADHGPSAPAPTMIDETVAEAETTLAEEEPVLAEPEADFGAEIVMADTVETVAEAEPVAETDAVAFDDDALLASLATLEADQDAVAELPPAAVLPEAERVAEAAPADDEDTLTSLLASLTADPAPVAEEIAAEETEASDADLMADIAEAQAEALPPADLAGLDMADAALATLEETASAPEDFAADLDEAAEAALQDSLAEDAPAAAAEPEMADKAQRARARVIRIRRAPAAPAELAETLPALDHVATEALADPAPETVLSPEAEADLMRELAEVQAEAELTPAAPVRPQRPVRPVRSLRPTAAPVAEAPAAPQPEPEVQPEPEPVAEPRNRLPEAEGEAAVSRLLAETNTQMQGPENRRRLSAIAHLKAAVAATVADRRIGAKPPQSETERTDPYRADLSRMVRPASSAPRSAPLVLVSEQRVDRPAEPASMAAPAAMAPARSIDTGPVRPRRVSGNGAAAAAVPQDFEDDAEDDSDVDENIFNDSKGFAEFAERLGAEGLPALLEAAAAYAACVEGRPHFSRPQLLRQVVPLTEHSDLSREDSLRSFGTLLRNGKIVKVKRGQYTLTDASHYLSEARKLVG